MLVPGSPYDVEAITKALMDLDNMEINGEFSDLARNSNDELLIDNSDYSGDV